MNGGPVGVGCKAQSKARLVDAEDGEQLIRCHKNLGHLRRVGLCIWCHHCQIEHLITWQDAMRVLIGFSYRGRS